jgi:hypothetical protein
MGTRPTSLAVLLLAVLLPQRAPAQRIFEVLRQARTSSTWKSGSWAEYAFYDAPRRTSSKLFVAVFQDADRSQWSEVTTDGETVFRSPLDGVGDVYGKRGEHIFRVGRAAVSNDCGAHCGAAVRGVPVRIETRVGVFDCRRIALPDGIFWVSDQVPGVLLVKAKFVDGGWAELLAYGSSVRSAFGSGFRKLAR